ncbi:MAG: histidine phosphatase family protein [Saprospiraceae bacterium]|nr:histidine phosphatase family protein [Saprospiraceae bacterium]
MTLYIIRHGETEFNKLQIVQGSGVNSDLNETGLEQALAFFKTYQHVDFELIVTSKLRRTHQTVQHFLDRDIPWIEMEDINEISWGAHEGLPATPERTALYTDMIENWKNGNLHASLPEGETAAQLLERVHRFVSWLKTRKEKHILIATHGRTLRCLITVMKNLGPADMEGTPHTNTGLYKVHYQGDMFVFELENDTSHLQEEQHYAA